VGQAGPEQPVELSWRGGDPIQENLQLPLELVSGWRFKVQALAADHSREHLHWGLIPQLTNTNGAQASGPAANKRWCQWFNVARERGASRLLVASIKTSSRPSTWALAVG